MTFFVVFYNSNCFGRYNDLYKVTKEMAGAILELSSSLKGRVEQKKHQRRAIRLMLASCFVFFYERENDDIKEPQWVQLRERLLLTDEEVQHLKKFQGCMMSYHLLHWSLEVIVDGIPNKDDHDDMINAFYDKVHQVRRCHQKIKDTLDLPMPFQYFHIMSFMMVINLVLWSYALAITNSFFSPIIYLFIQVIFQGIRELSAALADPFGDDDVDFPIDDWLDDMVQTNIRLVEDSFDPVAGVETEEALPIPEEGDVDVFIDDNEGSSGRRKAKVGDTSARSLEMDEASED